MDLLKFYFKIWHGGQLAQIIFVDTQMFFLNSKGGVPKVRFRRENKIVSTFFKSTGDQVLHKTTFSFFKNDPIEGSREYLKINLPILVYSRALEHI